MTGLAVVGMLASSVLADTVLPFGYKRASLVDRSSVYRQGQPIPTGGELEIGDEQRVIYRIDAINNGTLELGLAPPGTKQVFSDGGVPYTNGALTGMLYDLEIGGFGTSGKPLPGDPSDLYFVPGPRYKSDGTGTDGMWTDTVPSASVGAVTTAAGYGGIIVVYDDGTINTKFQGDGDGAVLGDGAGSNAGMNQGEYDWRMPGDLTGATPHPGAGVMAVPGVLTNADYFPTVSDTVANNPGATYPDSGTAVPWLIMVLAPLPAQFYAPPAAGGLMDPGAPTTTVLLEDEFSITGGASGYAFGNIIGGTYGTSMMQDVFGPGLDVRLDFDISVPGGGLTADGWQTRSDDPVQFGVSIIPEPGVMSLLGLGVLGLIGVQAKRKKTVL
jgi:hypothetical protein